MITKDCKNCHQAFSAVARRIQFCTNLCANLFNAQVRKDNHVAHLPASRICVACEGSFYSSRKATKHCSRKCAGVTNANKYLERFWSHVEKTDGCWTWKDGCHARRNAPKGYGAFKTKFFSSRFAHCFSYFLHYGEIPQGMSVLHHCDNPPCVRPDHLFLGTQADNVADMIAKGRANKARGSESGNAKLTDADICEIRARYIPRKFSHSKLARIFNVHSETIARILRNESWGKISQSVIAAQGQA